MLLFYAALCYAMLRCVALRYAALRYAVLSALLRCVKLRYAMLRRAPYAMLRSATLCWQLGYVAPWRVTLQGAARRGVMLCGATLWYFVLLRWAAILCCPCSNLCYSSIVFPSLVELKSKKRRL